MNRGKGSSRGPLKKGLEISRRLAYPGKFLDLAYTLGAYAPRCRSGTEEPNRMGRRT